MMNNVNDDAEKSLQDQRGDGEQITDDVYRSRSFDNKDFVCKPIKSDRCTIDENVLQFQYPFFFFQLE